MAPYFFVDGNQHFGRTCCLCFKDKDGSSGFLVIAGNHPQKNMVTKVTAP